MYHKCGAADGPFDRRGAASVRHAGAGPGAGPTDGRDAVKPPYWDEAVRELGTRDRVLRQLIATYPDIHITRRGDAFTTLARAIVGQQISVKAAQTIWNRLVKATRAGGEPVVLSPARLARTRTTTLRTVGLSERKADYLRDLARHFVSGRLDPSVWPAMDDEMLIVALTDVNGIGRWTAEMFLMFHELRADILPVGDIGLQNAMARHYFDGVRPAIAQMRNHAERWQPYRSVATWYLWRSLDPIPVEY